MDQQLNCKIKNKKIKTLELFDYLYTYIIVFG